MAMNKIPIGIGGSLHDYGACLIHPETGIIAIEDERVTRVKHSINQDVKHVPSVDYCVNAIPDISSNDIEVFGDDMINDRYFPNRAPLNHHLSHAISTFFTSPFDNAAILVLDGVGSLFGTKDNENRETISYFNGVDNRVDVIGKVFGSPSVFRCYPSTPKVRENSLGEFYRAITEMIGFGFLQAGKTMGLYPYGKDRFFNDLMKFVSLESGGQFRTFVKGDNGLFKYLEKLTRSKVNNEEERFQLNADLAFSAQKVLETILEHCLDFLWQVTDTPNLCIAGGVGLNSAANGKITKLSKFKNIHIPFAPGDNGAAIGAAIYGYIQSESNKDVQQNIRFDLSPYLGKEYSNHTIKTVLEENGINFTVDGKNAGMIANELKQDKVIALYQGKAEFGPRALGNRSILANPQSSQMKDRLNQIKGREWFRPVAPAVLSEELNFYFETDINPRWMQYVVDTKDVARTKIPSCVHVDNTARVQAVSHEDNPFFYELLESFGNVSGDPVLINTSFNIKGEPIIETPENALASFASSDIDILILGDYLVRK